MVGWVLLFFSLIAFTGCAGADDVSQGGSGGGGDESPGYGLPPGDNDSDFDDGSGWPRWKNPCPGPACDPYRGAHPEWIVDPPPDRERSRPGEPVEHPSVLMAPQSKTK